jgi:hypothetical protein
MGPEICHKSICVAVSNTVCLLQNLDHRHVSLVGVGGQDIKPVGHGVAILGLNGGEIALGTLDFVTHGATLADRELPVGG